MLYQVRRKRHFLCHLFGDECFSVGIGQYAQASYISIRKSFYYSILIKLSRITSSPLLFFFHSKLNVLIKIFDVMEKAFQVRAIKNGINVINKLFPVFWSSILFMNLHINLRILITLTNFLTFFLKYGSLVYCSSQLLFHDTSADSN